MDARRPTDGTLSRGWKTTNVGATVPAMLGRSGPLLLGALVFVACSDNDAGQEASPTAGPEIQTGSQAVRDLGTAAVGYRPAWGSAGKKDIGFGRKYSGSFGTYCAKHRPMAIYDAESNRTFFSYGGMHPVTGHLTINVGYFDHETGEVPAPTEVFYIADWRDPHNNPSIGMDGTGRLWVFASGRDRRRNGYRFFSDEPRSIDSFTLDDSYDFKYPQVWWHAGQGFTLLMTRYTAGRELYVQTSDESVTQWSAPKKMVGFGGHYELTTLVGDELFSAYNWHRNGKKCKTNCRTNLYFIRSKDRGATWTTADGTELELPINAADNPSLVHDYVADDLLVYLKDITVDGDNNPVVLYLVSPQSEAGPPERPRTLMTAHYRPDKGWATREVTTTDHNYDHGSIWVDGHTWWVLAPTGAGAFPHYAGGTGELWKSNDGGASWAKERTLAAEPEAHQNYFRKVEGAKAPFAAIWSSGDPRARSEGTLQFLADREGPALVLPRELTAASVKPVALQ